MFRRYGQLQPVLLCCLAIHVVAPIGVRLLVMPGFDLGGSAVEHRAAGDNDETIDDDNARARNDGDDEYCRSPQRLVNLQLAYLHSYKTDISYFSSVKKSVLHQP